MILAKKLEANVSELLRLKTHIYTDYIPHRQIRVLLCRTLVQRWEFPLVHYVTCLIRQVCDVVPNKCTLLT